MNDEQVVLTELTDGVLIVTLNRPSARNALSLEMSRQLVRVWERAATHDVRAVVVTGAGGGFCSGADLRDVRTGDVASEGLRVTYHPMVQGLVALEKPVIAAVNGAAAGAGLSLVLAADARIGSSDAVFVPAFGAIGLIPDSGVGYLAQRVLGEAAALRWLTSGRRLSSREALEMGLIESIEEDPVAAAVAIARELADVPGRAYGLTKRIMWAHGRSSLARYLDLEVELQQLAVQDPERAKARERRTAMMRQKNSTEDEGKVRHD